jgi:outer membrane receptor protein involved in Fe transport
VLICAFTVCSYVLPKSTYAQAKSDFLVSGTLLSDSDKNAIVGATIQLKNAKQNTISNTDGDFTIKITKSDTLVINFIGFETKVIPINLNQSDIDLGEIILKENATQIGEVTIVGKSANTEKKEEPFNVTVADVKKVENRPGDVSQIANQLPGVKLRFNGGLGSDYSISLFGMGGNSVRILKDGIPLEYFGKGFQLNNILPQNIERLEIYKGALPIYLGADALGGAVNIVSKPVSKKQLSISYEVGSFNTHRAAVSAFYPIKNKDIIFGISANLNFSSNNYFTDVQTANFTTGEIKDTTVRRFHDKFLSFSVLPQLRIINKKWADDFTINFGYGEYQKQLQHGFTLTLIPVGQASYSEKYIPINFNYKKTFKEKHLLQFDGAYNYTQTQFNDTSSNIFSWNGEVVAQNSQPDFGEIGYKSNAIQQRQTAIFREHYKYSINSLHTFEFAATQTLFIRNGTDDVLKEIVGYNPLQNTSTLFKNILGISYTYHSKNKRWNAIVSAKHFHTKIEGTENIVFIPTPFAPITNSSHFFGGNAALKYQISKSLFARVSYEYAGRLPNEIEALGDGLFINGNPNLKPEKSHNLNAGIVFQSNSEKNISAQIELNGFYRFVDDIIVLQNALFIPQFDNLFKAQGYGGEVDATVSFWKYVSLNSNLTYIDFRKKGFQDLTDKPLDGKRIPNIPYLFSNTSLTFSLKNIFTKTDGLQVYSNYQFVYEYYLLFDGGIVNTKPTIPTQHNLDAGIIYSLQNGKYNFAFETRNILNNNLYDNFRVQRAGRGFYGKLNFNF